MTQTQSSLQTQEIAVSHYSGCGNDFLLFDNRHGNIPEFSSTLIADLCGPKMGAGVDGLIIVGPSHSADVSMKFYNSDGFEAEMCGNGVRCLMQFLRQKLSYPRTRCLLETKHRELLINTDGKDVAVQMGEVQEHGWNIELKYRDHTYKLSLLDTGVPHLVIIVDNVQEIDVADVGAYFRYHPHFAPKGANVNFVEIRGDNTAHIRTYERGVERETLACGTGVTAAAYVLHKLFGFHSPISLRVQSGEWMQVLFELDHHGKVDVLTLKGPATWIRDGNLILDKNHTAFSLKFT
jgi:diaminopimelate epimerase